MAAKRPVRPKTTPQLIAAGMSDDIDQVDRLLADQADAIARLERRPEATIPGVFTTTADGLVPAPGSVAGAVLSDSGAWIVPAGGGDVLHTRAINTAAPLTGGGDLSADRTLGLSDGDRGDITVSASGVTWTIDAGAVSLAKLAAIATARFLGRITAGSGTPEELTGTQATTLLDIFTTTLKGLVPAPGAATGLFLRDDATWASAGGGTFAYDGGDAYKIEEAQVGLIAFDRGFDGGGA